MSFADDVIEFQRRRPKPRLCGTGVWLATLDDRSRETFDNYLAAGGQVTQLWRLAGLWGCEAAETRFRVHCRRECGCYTTMEVAA